MTRITALLLLLLLTEALAAAVPIVRPRDEDIRILEVRLDDQILTAELIAWQHPGGGILLPLDQLSRLLGLAITVTPGEGLASGFVVREDRRFHLDVGRGEVTLEGRKSEFDRALVQLHEDDVYVDGTLLSDWLGIDFDVDLFSLRLTVRPREPLPLQLRQARERKMLQSRARENPDRGFPFFRNRYSPATLPFIDQNLRLGWGSDQLDASYSTYATADLFGLESAWFVQGDRDEPLRDLRVTLGRKDPEPRLLGFLHAREISVGHVTSPGSTLLAQSRLPSPGILLSSYPLERPTHFTSHSFYGNLQPGWDVELYHNGSLIGYQVSRADARYEFEDVPLLFGFNFFQLVFYGPQGQRRVETHRFVVGASLTEPGEFRYRLSANRERGWVGPSASEPPDTYRAMAQMDLGLHKRLSAAAEGAIVPLPDGSQGRYGKIGLRTYLDFLFAWADYAQEEEGASARELGLQTRLLGVHVTASRIELSSDFVSEIFPSTEDQVHRRDHLRLDTSIPASFLPRIPISLEATRDELFSGVTRTRARNRLSTYYRGFSAATELRWERETGAEPRFEGAFQLSRFIRGHSVRGEVNYLLEPEPELSSVNLSADGFLAQTYRYQLGVTRSLLADNELITAGIHKILGRFALGTQLVYDTRGELSVRLDLSAGIVLDPRRDRWISDARPLAGFGAASVRAFLDENLNGVLDAGEEPIQGVTFMLDGARFPAVTDEQGIALLSRLPVYRAIDLGLAVRSLEDPAWVPRLEGVRFVPRPGSVIELDFPIVLTGEIDGTILAERFGRVSGVGGLMVQLTDHQGRVIQETESAYDGFYVFSAVFPGEYELRISPPDVARMKLITAPTRSITIEAEGTLLSGIDFALQLRSEEPQIAEQQEPSPAPPTPQPPLPQPAEPAEEQVAEERVAEQRPEEVPAVSDGLYVVQLGAYRVLENALDMAASAGDLGHHVRIDLIDGLHRVNAGPFATREEAARMRRVLMQNGLEAFVQERRDPTRTIVAGYRLEIGAYRQQQNALERLQMLGRLGYQGQIRVTDGLHLVSLGPFDSSAEAQRIRRELMAEGLEGFVTTMRNVIPRAAARMETGAIGDAPDPVEQRASGPPRPDSEAVQATTPAPPASPVELTREPQEIARTAHAEGAISGVVGYYVAASRRLYPAAGRTVLLVELGRKQITDAAGQFRFDAVPPGIYTLTVYVQGKPLSVQTALSPGTEASTRILLP